MLSDRLRTVVRIPVRAVGRFFISPLQHVVAGLRIRDVTFPTPSISVLVANVTSRICSHTQMEGVRSDKKSEQKPAVQSVLPVLELLMHKDQGLVRISLLLESL